MATESTWYSSFCDASFPTQEEMRRGEMRYYKREVANNGPSDKRWYWKVDMREGFDPAAREGSTFPSMQFATRKRYSQAKALKKAYEFALSREDYSWCGYRFLAEKLESCHPDSRCGSMACTVCMREHQRWQYSEALFHLKKSRPLFRAVLSLEKYVMKDGLDQKLCYLLCRMMTKRVREALPAGALVVGWLEITYEADLDGFLPHLHLVVGGCTREEVRALKPVLKRKQTVFRPSVIRKIPRGAEIEFMTYAVKTLPASWSHRKEPRPKGTGERKLESNGSSPEVELLMFLSGCRAERMGLYHGLHRERNERHLTRIKE